MHGAPVYFEAATVIIALILLGRLLEARAKARTGDAIGHDSGADLIKRLHRRAGWICRCLKH